MREEVTTNGKSPVGDETRTRRYVLVSIAFLLLALVATQIFLNQTSVGSTRFVPGTILLWTATVLVALALLILATVLGRNLIKLYFFKCKNFALVEFVLSIIFGGSCIPS